MFDHFNNKYVDIYMLWIYIERYILVFQAEGGTYLKALKQEGVWFVLSP